MSVSVLIQNTFLDSATLAGTGNTFVDFFNWFVDPVASLLYLKMGRCNARQAVDIFMPKIVNVRAKPT